MNVKISVLVPVYGVERYIADCARSLFGQSMHEGIEFIFVDDASPDRSIEILKEVLAEYPERKEQVRILHHQQNRGLAAARRMAIDAARGEWILHTDSDDILLPQAAESLLAAAGSGTDLIYGDYFAADNPADPASNRHIVRTPHWHKERLLRTLISQSHRITNRTWGILIRRTLYTEQQIYPVEGINFAEDYAVMPRLLHAARAVTVIRKTVYGYRLANDNSYMKRLDAQAANQYVAANRIVTDYLKRQSDYDTLRDCVILGRLNIEKWILRRGLSAEAYDAQLFYDGDRPRKQLHRIYAAAIESGTLFLVRLIGAIVNLKA